MTGNKTMDIKIRGMHVDLDDKTKDYVSEKIDMLEKYLGKITPLNCDVIIEKVGGEQHSGNIYRVEVNLELPHVMLSVDKTTDDINKSIDKAKDHLAEMIKSHKEKMTDRYRD